LVETFDAHDAGIYDTGRYKCACGWLGEESDWYPHLASKLAEAL
jgi:hypothetical protein